MGRGNVRDDSYRSGSFRDGDRGGGDDGRSFGRERYENGSDSRFGRESGGYGKGRNIGGDRGFSSSNDSRFMRDGHGPDRGSRGRDDSASYNYREREDSRYSRGKRYEDDSSGLLGDRSNNKPNIVSILEKKKNSSQTPPPPVVAPPLTLPGEDEEAARERIEKKKREVEEKLTAEKKQAEEAAIAEAAAAKLAAEEAVLASEKASTLLNEFASGNKIGEDLAQWCRDQGALLPPIEDLVYHLLTEREKKNPSINCEWAELSQYGSALLSKVEDDINAQKQVLWGIQKYCDDLGFPKLDNENVIQGMFRSMYKHDLALDEAFEGWKEDESESHEAGKMKAIIQTIDWFSWLEEEEDEEDEEEYKQ